MTWKLWALVAAVLLVIVGATGGFLMRHRAQRAELLRREQEAEQLVAEAPPALRELLKTVTLPLSNDGSDLRESPNVLINRDGIFLEGLRVAPLPASDRLQRVDEVFDALKRSRTAWKQQHPDKDFEGVVQFWMDENISVLAFKSLLQTAAFGGYPNASLVTRSRSNPRRLQNLPVYARIPLPPSADPDAQLDVKFSSDDRAELGWSGSAAPSVKSVSLRELPAAITEAWKNHPPKAEHKHGFSEALLLVPHQMRVRRLAEVLEAIFTLKAPENDYPIFFVTLSVMSPDGYRVGFRPEVDKSLRAPKLRMGAAVIAGRLEPAVIQARAREAFPAFRNCYEAGLGRDPNLTGTATVRFVIGRDGTVSNAELSPTSTLPDLEVRHCLVRAFEVLVFPEPVGGIVTVVYPIQLTPG